DGVGCLGRFFARGNVWFFNVLASGGFKRAAGEPLSVAARVANDACDCADPNHYSLGRTGYAGDHYDHVADQLFSNSGKHDPGIAFDQQESRRTVPDVQCQPTPGTDPAAGSV